MQQQQQSIVVSNNNNNLSKQQEQSIATTSQKNKNMIKEKLSEVLPQMLVAQQTKTVFTQLNKPGLRVNEKVCVPYVDDVYQNDFLSLSKANDAASMVFLSNLAKSSRTEITDEEVRIFIAINKEARKIFTTEKIAEIGKPIADKDAMLPIFIGFQVSLCHTSTEDNKRGRLIEFTLATPTSAFDIENFEEKFNQLYEADGQEKREELQSKFDELEKELLGFARTSQRTYKFLAHYQPKGGNYLFENLVNEVCFPQQKFRDEDEYMEKVLKAKFREYLFEQKYDAIYGVDQAGKYGSFLASIFGMLIVPEMLPNQRPPYLDTIVSAEGLGKESILSNGKQILGSAAVEQIESQTKLCTFGLNSDQNLLQSFTLSDIANETNKMIKSQKQLVRLIGNDMGGFGFQPLQQIAFSERKSSSSSNSSSKGKSKTKEDQVADIESNSGFLFNIEKNDSFPKKIAIFDVNYNNRFLELIGGKNSSGVSEKALKQSKNEEFGVSGFPMEIEEGGERFIQQKFVLKVVKANNDKLLNLYGEKFKEEFESSPFLDFERLSTEEIIVFKYLASLLNYANELKNECTLVCFPNPDNKFDDKNISSQFYKHFGGNSEEEDTIDFNKYTDIEKVRSVLEKDKILASRCALFSAKMVVGVKIPKSEESNAQTYADLKANQLLTGMIKVLNGAQQAKTAKLLKEILDNKLYSAVPSSKEYFVGIVPYYRYISNNNLEKKTKKKTPVDENLATANWAKVSDPVALKKDLWKKTKGTVNADVVNIAKDGNNGIYLEAKNQIPHWLLLSHPGKENIIDTYKQAHLVGYYGAHFDFNDQVLKFHPFDNLSIKEQKKYETAEAYIEAKRLYATPIAYRTVEYKNENDEIEQTLEYQLENKNIVFTGQHIVSRLSAFYLIQALHYKETPNMKIEVYHSMICKWLHIFTKNTSKTTKIVDDRAAMHYLPHSFIFCKEFLEFPGFYNDEQIKLYEFFERKYPKEMIESEQSNEVGSFTFVYLNPAVLVSDIFDALVANSESIQQSLKKKSKTQLNIEAKLDQKCTYSVYQARKYLYELFKNAVVFIKRNENFNESDDKFQFVLDMINDSENLIAMALQSSKEKKPEYANRICCHATSDKKNKTLSNAEFKKILMMYFGIAPFGIKGAEESTMVQKLVNETFIKETVEEEEGEEEEKDDPMVPYEESQTLPEQQQPSRKRKLEEAAFSNDQSEDESSLKKTKKNK